MQVQPFKVRCTNDKNIPNEIPKHLHVKEGDIYTVGAVEHLLSSPIIGFHLLELPLGEECFPYHYWAIHRFEQVNEAEEAMLEEALSDLMDVPYGA